MIQHVSSDTHYPGSKGVMGLAEWIIERLPAHAYYAEPFAGKGAVFRAKPPALRSWLIDRNREVATWWRRLKPPGTRVTNGDGLRFCELAAEWGPDDLLIYCDPPYLHETRVKKRIYRHEMTEADHRRLLAALLACRCGVTLSGYASPLYDETLRGWQRHTRMVITRGGVLREEVLWVNRLPASSKVTVEYSALGENWRERDRVSKKVRRWTSRILALPHGEQQALLRALVDAVQ